jgi:hypothetical protein
MRKFTIATLAALSATAMTTAGMTSANAYVDNGNGTYTVSAAELQAAFGSGVDLNAVTFSADGGNEVYLVTCSKAVGTKASPKAVGKKAKTVTHTFKRQAKVTWTVATAPTTPDGVITGFTVTTTAGTPVMSKVVCPKPFTQQGSPTLHHVKPVELKATYNGVTVVLTSSTN